jgi:predicted Zn-dependent peptidase
MHPIHTLPNGIKLVHKYIDAPISHFGVLINAGTRDEKPEYSGLAHFVEHTIFKGTQKRNSGQVIRYMENVGGEINASTSKEETYFHASFLSSDSERAIELLSDIFFHATFPEKELIKEKDVILEEINYYNDTPSELIFDDFETLIYDTHPLGNNILGTKKSLQKISKSAILEFIAQNYTAENVVLSYVGKCTEIKMLHLCTKYFGQQAITSNKRIRSRYDQYTPKTIYKKKKTAQAHLVMGNIAYSISHENRYPLMLLTNLLGGQGLNTRLNLAVREKKGLAYSVEANYNPFSDSGLFTIYLGCDNNLVEKCTEIILKELKKLRTEKLGTLQLHYAKKQFLGQLAISNESKLNEMLSLGRSALFFEEIETLEEAIRSFENITSEKIIEVSNEILVPEQFSTLVFHK